MTSATTIGAHLGQVWQCGRKTEAYAVATEKDAAVLTAGKKA
jgi:hypothetical protein